MYQALLGLDVSRRHGSANCSESMGSGCEMETLTRHPVIAVVVLRDARFSDPISGVLSSQVAEAAFDSAESKLATR
jgi:hypothetical protein